MAVTSETLRLLQGIRLVIDDTVDLVTNDLVFAWARAWNEVYAEWQDAVAQLEEMREDGQWPSRAKVLRAERVAKALFQTRRALDDLAQVAGVRVVQSLDDAVETRAYLEVIRSQLPTRGDEAVTLRASLVRADRRQIDAIVQRTTEFIVSRMKPIGLEGESALRRVLVRGVATGTNPRRAAALLLRRLEGGFNGGLTRALVITRTEMLDAHRAAAQVSHQANSKVVGSWMWVSALDKRTCPSCWAKHGTEYPLSQPGPEDHQQGRCARLPVTKSWADLGFEGIEEPPSLVPDAAERFASLPRATQLQIMGKQRLALLDSGDVRLRDLTLRRTTPGWRDSWGVRSLSDLV